MNDIPEPVIPPMPDPPGRSARRRSVYWASDSHDPCCNPGRDGDENLPDSLRRRYARAKAHRAG